MALFRGLALCQETDNGKFSGRKGYYGTHNALLLLKKRIARQPRSAKDTEQSITNFPIRHQQQNLTNGKARKKQLQGNDNPPKHHNILYIV
jgi:hypothetical protein